MILWWKKDTEELRKEWAVLMKIKEERDHMIRDLEVERIVRVMMRILQEKDHIEAILEVEEVEADLMELGNHRTELEATNQEVLKKTVLKKVKVHMKTREDI